MGKQEWTEKPDFFCRRFFSVSVFAFRQGPLEPKYRIQPKAVGFPIAEDPLSDPEIDLNSGQFFFPSLPPLSLPCTQSC